MYDSETSISCEQFSRSSCQALRTPRPINVAIGLPVEIRQVQPAGTGFAQDNPRIDPQPKGYCSAKRRRKRLFRWNSGLDDIKII